MNTQQEPLVIPATKQGPSIKIFGIGSAGVSILDQLARDGIVPGSLIAIHSDASALAVCAAAEKVQVENKSAGGLTPANEPGRRDPIAGGDALPQLGSLCAGVEVVMILAGMGGALGTRFGAVLAGAARRAGAFVLAFVVLPYECEGSRRTELADAGLARLRESADLVICWPNQKTLGLITEATSLVDTFNASNRLLANCVHGAWRAFGSKAAIGLGFLDLCHAIRSTSNACRFGVAEAFGVNRASEAADRLLAHPMLAAGDGLQNAKAFAVCVLGGPALTMTEVNRIMEQVQRRFETAPLAMGAAIAPELGETLLLGLLLVPAEELADRPESTEENGSGGLAPRDRVTGLGMQLLQNDGNTRRSSRFLPPPPSLPPEKMEQLLKQQARSSGRARKGQSNFRQTQLPLEILSKGRFDKSEPTIHKGEDLDVPTYIRRGVALN